MITVKGQSFSSVLFDLDGTLLDTLEDIADSANAALRELGIPPHPTDAYRYMVGDGVEALIRRMLPKGRADDDATVAHCGKLYRSHYGRNWNNKTRLYDGIGEMLDGLSRRGIALAILSNKPQEFTVQCVGAYLSRWKFAAVIGQREGIPRKPDPAGAAEISHLMKRPSSEFVYLGDTATDMKTAVAAGMFPVGVLWGFRQRDELEQHGAKIVIEHPSELFDVTGADVL